MKFVWTILVFVAIAGWGCQDRTGPGSGGMVCQQDRDCDDSIPCTIDRCVPTVNSERRCDNTPDDSTCASGNVCMIESSLGPGCQNPDKLSCFKHDDGDECRPFSACAVGDGHCESGLCVYPEKECPEKQCLESFGCDPATGTCEYIIASDVSLCDADNDRCTVDYCNGGVCRPGPDECECSQSRPCVQPIDRCMGQAVCVDGVCVSDPVDCASKNTDCMQYSCVPATGLCVSVPVNSGGPCTDDKACTDNGVCSNGACVTTARVCPEKECNTVECVEPTGCVYTPLPGECDDGDICNGPDACDQGVCSPVGSPVDCDDSNDCTNDLCAPATGKCSHVPILDCCGNGLLESAEQCDGPGQPGSGCVDCTYQVASLDWQGMSPSWAWSEDVDAGIVAWDVVDTQGGHGVAVRRVSALGAFGVSLPVPAGTVRDRSMWPVVTSSPGGFVLGAVTEQGPTFWLVDGNASPRIRSVARGSSGPWTGAMVMAYSPLRSVAAWIETRAGAGPAVMYSDIAVSSRQLLVSSAATLYQSGINDLVQPGNACAVDDGTVVMFAVTEKGGPKTRVLQKAAWFQAGKTGATILDLASSEWDQPFTGRCVTGSDGTVLTVYPKLITSPTTAIVIESVSIDPMDGPGLPTTVFSGTFQSQEFMLPLYSDLMALPDGGYLYLCTMLSPGAANPDRISPVLVQLDETGRPVSGPVYIDGPGLSFAGQFSAGLAGNTAFSVFWVETDSLSMIRDQGVVAGRLYPLPAGGGDDAD